MFKRVYIPLLFIIISFVPTVTKAESSYADSLQKIGLNTTNPQQQLTAYNQLAFYYNITLSEKAYIYGIKAYELATKLKLPHEQCKALVWQAVYNSRKQQYTTAILSLTRLGISIL